jgi:hypothetical protein
METPLKPCKRSNVYVRRDAENDVSASLTLWNDGSASVIISNGERFATIPVEQWRALVSCVDHEIDLNM